MSELFYFRVLPASAYLFVGYFVVSLALRLGKLESARLHRLVWAAVLLQGVLLLKPTLDIPWYESSARNTSQEPLLEQTTELGIPAVEQWKTVDSSSASVSVVDDGSQVARKRLVTVGPASIANASTYWPWQRVVVWIWLTGIAAVLAVWFRAAALLFLKLRQAEHADGPFQEEWQTLLRQTKIGFRVPLLLHDELGPFLCLHSRGYAVVVPKRLWHRLSSRQRRLILTHELAHLVRRDIPISLLCRLVAVLHWFNPASWWAVKRFDEAAEWACDSFCIRQMPQDAPDFARTLLAIATRPGLPLSSAAGGSSISHRVRRLVRLSNGDSVRRRLFVVLVAMGFLTVSGLQINLVPQASFAVESPDGAAESVIARFEDWSNKLVRDSELANRFADLLQTEAGRIAIQEQIAGIEHEMLEQQREEALPTFLSQVFHEANGEVTIRPESQELVDNLVATVAQAQKDIRQITPVLHEVAARISTDNDENRLLKRFLMSEDAATLLYHHGLREQLRPDVELIEERLGEIFVTVNGKHVLRAGRRDEAAELLKVFERAEQLLDVLKADWSIYADDLDQADPATKRLKTAMGEPLFQVLVALRVAEEEGSIQRAANAFFDQLEHILADGPNGLMVRTEAKEEVNELLNDFQRIERGVQVLSGPVTEYADSIDVQRDALHAKWAHYLKSPFGLVRLAAEYELSTADPTGAVKNLMSEVVEEDESGRLRVRTERAEEITEQVQDMLRTNRQLRRRGRPIDQLATKVKDRRVAEALQSITAKVFIVHQVQRQSADLKNAAVERWANERFESTGDRLMIRDEAREAIEEIITHAKEIENELSKDDF